MSVRNTEGFRFTVVTTGNADVDSRKPTKLRHTTLDSLLRAIDAKSMDEQVKEELKKMAKGYPEQALESWKKNFNLHVQRARQKVRDRNKPLPAPEPESLDLPASEAPPQPPPAPAVDEFAD